MNKLQSAHIELTTNGALTSCGFVVQTKLKGCGCADCGFDDPDRFKTCTLAYLGQHPVVGDRPFLDGTLKSHFDISNRFEDMTIDEIEAVKKACLERRRRYKAERAESSGLGELFS